MAQNLSMFLKPDNLPNEILMPQRAGLAFKPNDSGISMECGPTGQIHRTEQKFGIEPVDYKYTSE